MEPVSEQAGVQHSELWAADMLARCSVDVSG